MVAASAASVVQTGTKEFTSKVFVTLSFWEDLFTFLVYHNRVLLN